jgi:hypothetical protein
MSTNDLMAALDAARQSTRSEKRMKVDTLFGDQPDVLDSIRNAAKRGLSPRYIAELISGHLDGDSVSEGAVANWLRAQGET